jgi:hypothetical protein
VEARRTALDESADALPALVTRGAGRDLLRLRVQVGAEIRGRPVPDQALDAAERGGGAELRERELIKMDALTTAVAGALRERGVEGLTATLVAQVGVAAFMTAFQQWTEAQEPRDFSSLMDDALGASAQLSAIRTDQPCPAAIFPADSGVPGWLASGMQ